MRETRAARAEQAQFLEGIRARADLLGSQLTGKVPRQLRPAEGEMKVSDVMTFGVATISPEASLADAAKTLLDHRISGLPVVDSQDRLVGIVTEGDLIRTVSGLEGTDELVGSFHSTRVEQVMTRTARTIDTDAAIEEAVELISQSGLRAVPVTAGGRVIGMFSRPDLIGYLLEAKR